MPDDLENASKARHGRLHDRFWKGLDWNSQITPITEFTAAKGILFKMTPEEVWEAVLPKGGLLKAEPNQDLREFRARVDAEANRRLE